MTVATQDKPVLDEKAFQRLLAAAYTLQEFVNRVLLAQAKNIEPSRSLNDMPSAPSDEPVVVFREIESLQVLQADIPEPTQSDGNSAGAAHPCRSAGKTVLHRQLLWKFAGAAILSTVSGFLMAADHHPFSALPFALWPATQLRQRSLYLELNQYSATVPISISSVERSGHGPELVATEHFRAAHSRTRHLHHSRSSEAYVVAPDTVVRYGTGSATDSQIEQEP